MRRLYYGLLVSLTALGLWAIGVRLTAGIKVTALKSYAPWGLWVSFYIFFIGLSAGSFLLSTLIYVFGMKRMEKVGPLALLTALFSLIGGLAFIFIDLGHPERFWHTLVYRNVSSVLEWEIYFYLFYIILLVSELWLVLRDDLARQAKYGRGWKKSLAVFFLLGYRSWPDPDKQAQQSSGAQTWVKTLGILGIPTAIAVHGGTGSIFGVLIAKPYWNSAITPIIFLVSALASGAALVTFLVSLLLPEEESRELLPNLGSLLSLFISIDLLLVAADFLVGLYGGIPSDAGPLRELVQGRYSGVFWVLQLGLGAFLPLFLTFLAFRTGTRSGPLSTANSLRLASRGVLAGSEASFGQKKRRFLGLACLSAVLGILGVRIDLIFPAFVVPQIPGLEKAYVDPRLSYSYSPNVMEWLVSLGIIAGLVLFFSLAWEVLPIGPSHKELEYGKVWSEQEGQWEEVKAV